MLQQFINREEELSILKRRYGSENPEFLIVYGRRRIGKTELITHSIKGHSNIYFLAEERPERENIKEMQELMGDFLGDEEFRMLVFGDWTDLFKSFSKRAKKAIIVIDEFPYLVKQNKSVPSKFQKIWDLWLKKTDVILILVGSSVSMMEGLLGANSPLHGRRTGQLEVKPVNIRELSKFLVKYSPQDLVGAYGCLDGIPLYLKQFDSGKPLFANIEQEFLKRDSLMHKEAEILLKQEFRDTSNYFSILRALAFGNVRQHDIAAYTGIDKSIVSKYLQNLETIRVVRKEYVITDRKEKQRTSSYNFRDNYFRFWFRFVYPNKTAIEKGESAQVLKSVKEGYSHYMGGVFEEFARQWVWELKPIKFTRAGRWWEKDKEIDIVAYGENSGEIAFFECKWKSLTENQARRVLTDLRQKSECVRWKSRCRKEHFGIFAKMLENKENLRKEGYLAYDLDDFALSIPLNTKKTQI
jgi:hypothetical protein